MPVASRLLSPAGDKSAKYGSIPWHAQIAVEEDRRSKTLTHLCSGVIVSNRYVSGHKISKFSKADSLTVTHVKTTRACNDSNFLGMF